MNTYCQDCTHYPCPDIKDDDTEILDCDYKERDNEIDTDNMTTSGHDCYGSLE